MMVAIIGTVGLPANYGGFETLTEYLTKYLGDQYDFTVYCSSKSYLSRPKRHNNAKLIYLPLNANGIQSIPYDIISIIKALRYADTLLILGVSGCIVLPIVKLFSKKKIVVNIDGCEWKREKWGKLAKLFLRYSEKQAVNFSDIVVTDNKIIQEYVKNEYGKISELIAYGADHVKKVPLSQEMLDIYPFLNEKYAFSVCRIEPENNLHIIIDAMIRKSTLSLVIIGNWKASKYGRDLYMRYSKFEHVHLLDPIYAQETLNQIRANCFIYIHGHSAGGTNPSLIEAMYLGLPIYAYKVSYNEETTAKSARYFSNSNELTQLINQSDEKSISKLGGAMKDIARKHYLWEKVSKQYALLLN